MDPLVDAYSQLLPEDKSKIGPEVRDHAIKETRKFLVEIVLVSGVLLFVSLAQGCLKIMIKDISKFILPLIKL